MPVQDFLVTFKTDTSQALASINALYQRVQQVDAALNRGIGRASNIGRNAGALNQVTQAAHATAAAVQQANLALGRLGNNPNTSKQAQTLLRQYRAINSDIRSLRAIGEPVPTRLYTRAIQVLEKLGMATTGAARHIRTLQQELRNERGVDAQANAIARLNQRFRELDATLGRAGGMTSANIRRTLDVINQLNSLGGTAAGADPRAFRMGNILSSALKDESRVLDSVVNKWRTYGKTVEEEIARAHRLQVPLPQARTIARAFDEQIAILRTPGLRGEVYEEAGRRARVFADELSHLPPGLDRATRAFGAHARRIAEGILLYDAFGYAIQGAIGHLQLVGDLARERIRFEATIGAGVGSEFFESIGRTATDTNTPLAELAAIMDTVAVATDRAESSTKRQADALAIMRRIGEFTNVSQRDLQIETENLIGIMSVFNLELREWENVLGGITVMGRNSARVIQAITDVLTGAGRAAETAGIDINLLGGIGSEVFQRLLGDMSGTEISSQLTTIFGKFADPSVQRDIEETTDGLIRFTDTEGNLRDLNTVFTELFVALNKNAGVLSDSQISETLDKLVPPLNPGARSFIEIMIDTFPQAMSTAQQGATATAKELERLSELLVSGPAEQFSKALIGIQEALFQITNSEISTLIGVIASSFEILAEVLKNDVGQGIAGVAIQVVALATALKAFSFFKTNLGVLLLGSRKRYQELADAMRNATVASGTLGGSMATAATSVDRAGGRARTLTRQIGLLAKAMAVPLTLFIAIELIDDIPDVVRGIRGSLNSELSSGIVDPAVLDIAFSQLAQPDILGVNLTSIFGGDFAGTFSPQLSGLTRTQFENVKNLASAMQQLSEEGKLNADAQKILDRAVSDASGTILDQVVSVEDILAAYNEHITTTKQAESSTGAWEAAQRRLEQSTRNTTEAVNELTTAEERELNTAGLNSTLANVRAAEYDRLGLALQNGAISLDQFTEGQGRISTASEAAAAWVAHFGDQLSLIPGLAERVASTGESAAEALFHILTANPETSDAAIGIINDMIAISEANAEVAQSLKDTPIEAIVDNEELLEGVKDTYTAYQFVIDGTRVVQEELTRNPLEPQIALERLREQLQVAIQMYQILLSASAAANRALGSAASAANPEVRSALNFQYRSGFGRINELNKAIGQLEAAGAGLSAAGADLAALGRSIPTVGGIRSGDARLGGGGGGGGAGKQPSQTSVVDIGDLSPALIAQIIAMATAAQRKVIAAGGTVDKDETVAIFKDAVFRRFVSGIDQRFLTEAIRELTEVEKARLDEERKRASQEIIRNLAVRAGPLGALISQPTMYGVGGGIPAGLNARPEQGNFQINVPVELKGLEPAQLQNIIYQIITKAIRDGLRLQGSL